MLLNTIADTVLAAWQTKKTHKSPSGWISANAVCCEHNGETKDTRSRGGILIEGSNVSYNCFNCHWSAKYSVGFALSARFQKLLTWLNFTDQEIGKMRLMSLQSKDAQLNNNLIAPIIQTCELPHNSKLLIDVADQYSQHVSYLQNRGFSLNDYPFFVSDAMPNQMRHRVILPFYRNGHIVGYTARAIKDLAHKYHMKMSSPYVFGLDLQKPDWTWTIATEGPFDALAVNGLSFLGSEVNDAQAELVKRLNTKIVIVADNDAAGSFLIDDALNYGWSVSFPNWPSNIKDLNDAVLAYGKLFVVRHVWNCVINNPLQIKIMKKLLQSNKKQ